MLKRQFVKIDPQWRCAGPEPGHEKAIELARQRRQIEENAGIQITPCSVHQRKPYGIRPLDVPGFIGQLNALLQDSESRMIRLPRSSSEILRVKGVNDTIPNWQRRFNPLVQAAGLLLPERQRQLVERKLQIPHLYCRLPVHGYQSQQQGHTAGGGQMPWFGRRRQRKAPATHNRRIRSLPQSR